MIAVGQLCWAFCFPADLFNRQLSRDETATLEQSEKGKSAEEQQRLADAACALERCSAGVPDSDPAKTALVASEQRGQQYMAEQDQLQSSGPFGYTGLDRFNDAADRYQILKSRAWCCTRCNWGDRGGCRDQCGLLDDCDVWTWRDGRRHQSRLFKGGFRAVAERQSDADLW